MRYLIIILLLCISTIVYCRPSINQEADNSDKEDSEYDTGGDEGQVDDGVDDSDSRFAEEESSEDDEQEDEALQDQREQETNGNSYSAQTTEDNPVKANSDNFSGYKNSKRRNSGQSIEEVNNSEYETPTKEQEANIFIENTVNQPETISDPERITNDKNSLNKRNPISRTSNDDLCENNEVKKNNVRNEFDNEDSDPQEQVQYFNKYYNPLHEGIPAEKTYENNLNRDRRAAQETNDTCLRPVSNNNLDIDDKSIDEEAAIKKHIKKLSSEELEELLNSLTDDKKQLLKKIMESDVESENEINKREITKKAGAAPDDTANLESGISDANKLQSENPEAESNSQTLNTETTEASKQPNAQSELNVLPVTKTLEANNGTSSTSTCKENKAELFDTSQGKSDVSWNTIAPLSETNNQVKDLSNLQESKISSKREASSNFNFDNNKQHNDFKDPEGLPNESNNFYNQDEDLTQLLQEESKLNNEGNIMKREAFIKNDADFSESMKSLEESFPNSNSYDFNDPYIGSDLVPLVRVKRRNTDATLKKRAAGILPDARVAYFPYRAENDDVDSDEGNEFDDDSFYDRSSNLAKIDSKDDQPREDDALNFQGIKKKLQNSQNSLNDKLVQSEMADTNNMESDTMNLGSDSDSVLSSVEGVNDNLMYNSGARNKRLTESLEGLNDNSVDESNLSHHSMRSTLLEGTDAKSATENYVGAPNYHENDAFGPLPRNYDGELGRYKRIRRVKQTSSSQDLDSSDTQKK